MRHYNPVAYVCVSVIFAIPFLPQLKVMMDWTFVKTSLTLFQWFQLEDFAQVFYASKINMKSLTKSRVGEAISAILKFLMGWCGQFVVLLIIFLPMILFSTLNTLGDINPITSMDFSIGLQAKTLTGNLTYPLWEQNQIMHLQNVVKGDA